MKHGPIKEELRDIDSGMSCRLPACFFFLVHLAHRSTSYDWGTHTRCSTKRVLRVVFENVETCLWDGIVENLHVDCFDMF